MACGDLKEMFPTSLMHINTLSAVIGTVLRVLGVPPCRRKCVTEPGPVWFQNPQDVPS